MYKKKYTKHDLYLLNKYLFKFKKDINNETILCTFKTKNYIITIYQNKTLLIQGSNYDNILKMIDNEELDNKNITTLTDNIIGSDEVGTGDSFGGIVVCACFIEKQNIEKIKELGVDDSKKISNTNIKNLYFKIKDFVKYEITNLFPNEYNKMYDQYNNANILKAYGHHQAIKNLVKKLNLNQYSCVIDEFTPLINYKKYLSTLKLEPNNNEITITKAESKYIHVAAASIIARYYFIKQIDELSNNSKVNIPFGSSTSIIKEIINEIKLKKLDLRNYAKLHFNIFKKF